MENRVTRNYLIAQSISENFEALQCLEDNKGGEQMEHYLCIKDRVIDKDICFKEGKVYSGRRPATTAQYITFMNEQGESHPMENDKLKQYFKEVYIAEPKEITLEDKQKYLRKSIQSNKTLMATGAVTPLGIGNFKRRIKITEAILNDLEQLTEMQKKEAEPQQSTGMTTEEYENIMKVLDIHKHTNAINVDTYRYTREIVTLIYKKSEVK